MRLHDKDTLGKILPEVEINSTNAGKKVESSSPLYRIDSEQIKTTGVTDIADAMRRMPGVNIRDYGGAGGLKTVSVRGLGTEHTAVIYDGVSLNDCQSGQIDLSKYSIDNISVLSLYSVDNDDIFIPAKAAASSSSLYISSFELQSEREKGFGMKAQVKVGAFGYVSPYLRVSGNNKKGFSWSANVQYVHSVNDYPFTLKNGSLVTREKRENSLMNAWTGELNGRWMVNNSSLTAKLYFHDNSRDLPGQVIYYVNGSNEHLRDRDYFGQLKFRGKLSTSFSVAAIGKFNCSSSRYTDRNGKYPGGLLDNHYVQRETYISGSLLFTPGSGLSMDYSADWAYNNLSSNLKSDIRPYRNTILQTLAVKWKSRRASVMARALYSVYINKAKDGESGKNYSRLSPSVNVNIRPFEDINLYVRGSYKNIFRMPTFNEAYFDHYGSINLRPEMTNQLNAGITFEQGTASFLNGLSLTCDGYVNHVRNKIVAVPYNMFVWTMTNLGKVRVYGIDVSLNCEIGISPSHALVANGSYSYQRAQPRTNPESVEWMKQVAYIPLNSGSASLTWRNPWINFVVHGTGCSARYTTNQNIPETRIAGYWDTGISAFRKFYFRNNSIETKFELLNIFDKQYDIIARYPMPGRSWRFSVDFEI